MSMGTFGGERKVIFFCLALYNVTFLVVHNLESLTFSPFASPLNRNQACY